MEKYDRVRKATEDNTTRRMHYVCRVTKARTQTHTRGMYIYYFSTATTVMRKRPNVTLYVYCLPFSNVTAHNTTQHSSVSQLIINGTRLTVKFDTRSLEFPKSNITVRPNRLCN